jgi:hypothetical protein
MARSLTLTILCLAAGPAAGQTFFDPATGRGVVPPQSVMLALGWTAAEYAGGAGGLVYTAAWERTYEVEVVVTQGGVSRPEVRRLVSTTYYGLGGGPVLTGYAAPITHFPGHQPAGTVTPLPALPPSPAGTITWGPAKLVGAKQSVGVRTAAGDRAGSVWGSP